MNSLTDTLVRLGKAGLASITVVCVPILFLSLITGSSNALFLLVVAGAAAHITAAGVLFVALPVHFILTKLRWYSAVPYVAAGFVVPALIVLSFYAPEFRDPIEAAGWSAFYGGFGLIAAWAFWAVAVRGSANA